MTFSRRFVANGVSVLLLAIAMVIYEPALADTCDAFVEKLPVPGDLRLTIDCRSASQTMIIYTYAEIPIAFGDRSFPLFISADRYKALQAAVSGGSDANAKKQAAVALRRAALDDKTGQKSRRLLNDPSFRKQCLDRKLVGPLWSDVNAFWLPPPPGSELKWAWGADAAHPDQTITDLDLRAAIVLGGTLLNQDRALFLPTNTPFFIPQEAGARVPPNVSIRFGEPDEFVGDNAIARVKPGTKTPRKEWATGEILINPKHASVVAKDISIIADTVRHELRHIYGLEHSEAGTHTREDSIEQVFFRFGQPNACPYMDLHDYYLMKSVP